MGKSAFYERGFSGEGLTVGSSLITSHYFNHQVLVVLVVLYKMSVGNKSCLIYKRH